MQSAAEKHCDFCTRPRNEVKRLISGPDAKTFICDNCVRVAADRIAQAAAQENASPEDELGQIKKPREIKTHLDQYVISQEQAKRAVAIAVYKHYRRREAILKGGLVLDGEPVTIEKSNILLLGPSGTGKTHIARSVAKLLKVPFYVADATSLTQAGYVGNDVESILQGLMADAGQVTEKAEWGIVFIDEFDKLARKSGRSASGHRDITGEGVQQALLKLLEGSKVLVPRGMGNRAGVSLQGQPAGDMIDTANVLFICAGSFAGIDAVINERLNKATGIGFGKTQASQRSKTEIYKNVSVEDIENFGLIPEIVGRLPVITSTYELTEDELIEILTKPKDAIAKQFRALYQLENIKLSFDPAALRAIAKKAVKRSTGARALRSIVEEALEPYSFDAPDDSGISEILVTEEAVAEPGKAIVTRHS